jgi:hypothetical protein
VAAPEVVRAIGFEPLEDLDGARGTCLVQGRRVPLRVVDVVDIVESRPARSRIRSGPHQQADPLQVLLAELAQCQVRPVPAGVLRGRTGYVGSRRYDPSVVFARNS